MMNDFLKKKKIIILKSKSLLKLQNHLTMIYFQKNHIHILKITILILLLRIRQNA